MKGATTGGHVEYNCRETVILTTATRYEIYIFKPRSKLTAADLKIFYVSYVHPFELNALENSTTSH